MGADRPVRGPSDLTRSDYRAVVRATIAEIRDDDVSSLASAVAFRIFLSLFPAMLAGVAAFSLFTTPAELPLLLDEARNLLPPAAIDVLRPQLVQVAGTTPGAARGLLTAGVLGGLWAAMGAAQALLKALNRAYEVSEDRKFLPSRGVALAITMALFVTLAALVGLVVLGRTVQSAVLPEALRDSPVAWLLSAGRFLAAVLLLVLLFAFVYWVGPNREQPRWHWLSPGAVLGVVGWLLVAGGFTLYARTFGSYQATYGALAGVVVLLLWLQLSMLVLLVGAELNAELEKARDHRRAARASAPHGRHPSAVQPAPQTVVRRPPAAAGSSGRSRTVNGGTRVGALAAVVTALIGFVLRRRQGA